MLKESQERDGWLEGGYRDVEGEPGGGGGTRMLKDTV